MKIDIYLSENCGSYHELRTNLDQALSELNVAADVTYHRAYYDDAVSRGIKGSPSIWMNKSVPSVTILKQVISRERDGRGQHV